MMVENKTGVLNRVASTLRNRGFNIQSVAVGQTEQEGIARMTFAFDGEKNNIDQVIKQLNKLINVIEVWDATSQKLIIKETLLMKVKATTKTREEVLQFAKAFQAKIDAVYQNSLILELTGKPNRISDFVEIMRGFGIVEMVKTGATVIENAE